MKERRVGVAVAAIGLLAQLFGAPPAALACSCTGPVGRRALSKAAAMFTGTATSVQFLEPDRENTEPAILVTFRVSRVWKGPVQKVLKLRTTSNKWTCQGSSFEQGGTYLVTAYKLRSAAEGPSAPELAEVNTCGGTRAIDQAGDILAELGPGKKPGHDEVDGR